MPGITGYINNKNNNNNATSTATATTAISPGRFAVQVVTGVVQGKADAPGLLRQRGAQGLKVM